jgi:hypothetical protein
MLPTQCKYDIRSSVMLRSLDLELVNDVSGQPIGHSLKVKQSWKVGLTGYSESPVNNYQYTLRNIPEERRSLICILLKYQKLNLKCKCYK